MGKIPLKNIFVTLFTVLIFFLGYSSISAFSCWCNDRGPTPKGGYVEHHKYPCPDCYKAGTPEENCLIEWMGYSDNAGVKYCCFPYYCIRDDCNECVPECKAPLLGTDKQDIYLVPDAFSCTDSEPAGCTNPETRYTDCWEVPSPQPNIALAIHPENLGTRYGFTSDTHTGGGTYSASEDNSVNDFIPYSQSRYSVEDNVFYMQSTFTDTDKPIEAMYVWFSKSDTAPVTPRKIDLNNDVTPLAYGTKSKSDFGFVLHYNDSSWVPYVPAIYGTGSDSTDWWKKANSYQPVTTVDGKKIFSLPGKGGNVIANIIIYSIDVQNNGKKVILKYGVSFKEKSAPYELLANRPIEGKYNIWLMANDTFGFTPYDNYTKPDSVVAAIHDRWKTKERIRFFDQWKDSGQDWRLNFDKPNIVVKIDQVGKTRLKISWDFIPDPDFLNEFNKLIFNVYKSEQLSIQPLNVVNLTTGTDATSNIPENPFPVETIAESGDIIGHINHTLNRYLFIVRGGVGDGSVTIDLGDVGSGFLDFYLTAFDDGGNVASSGSNVFDLRDWMITEGGLFYTKSTDFSVANLTSEPDGWAAKGVLPAYIYADLSTELVGIKSAGTPIKPTKSLNTLGYMVRPYISKDVAGYYATLSGIFDRKKQYIPNLVEIKTNTLSGSLSGTFGLPATSIGYTVSSNLVVNNNFVCDGKAIFFVSGNLTLNGNIKNSNINRDACIFVVGGQVVVNEGSKSSNIATSNMLYDSINAYILSDGTIDLVKEAASPIFDGLYINGGLHSLSSDGVKVQRRLKLQDKLKYPVLVVENHSKYGVLGRTLFGGSLEMQKTEVGIKPF